MDSKTWACKAGLLVLPTHTTAHKMNAKIWIEKTGNTLRLVWYYDGSKKQLSLGVRDNPIGRAFAARKMADIKIDLESGYYDPTLLKYKPRKLGKNPTEISAVELFEKYFAHYKKERSDVPGTLVRLKAVASKLKQFLGDRRAEDVNTSVAKDVVARWSETASVQTMKQYLQHLRACWNWAEGKYHVSDPNPWNEVLARSRAKSNRQQAKQQIKPFTIAELQAIIAAFTHHPDYSHYGDFVTFLANTGCRFGEAAGLRWKHLGLDYSTVWIGESISRGHQKGTKTGKNRTIQLPPTLTAILHGRCDRLNPQPDDLVFPNFETDLTAFTTYLLALSDEWVTATIRGAGSVEAVRQLNWEMTVREDSIAATRPDTGIAALIGTQNSVSNASPRNSLLWYNSNSRPDALTSACSSTA